MTGSMIRINHSLRNRNTILLAALTAIFFTINVCDQAIAEDQPISITSPTSGQVIQRTGFDPHQTANAEPGAAAFGHARIEVQGTLPAEMPAEATLQYRVVLEDGGQGRPTDWTPISSAALNLQDGAFHFFVIVSAGGWYRLELTTTADFAGPRGSGAAEHFGVGEVLVIAGQSYATNTNEERLRISDPQARVSALNVADSTWAAAHDPQPTPDGSDGGSIWPAMGDSLLKEFQVPIGFANVAVGGTSSRQWMPDGKLHPRLQQAGKSLGRFRAVLWQQGESDVIAKTSVETYVANLQTIRKSAVQSWGFEPVWLLAKSTHHPTVYNDPEGEGRIRQATEQLWTMPGFGVGPDTDTLTGENRGDQNSRRHFSAIGQRRAAAMWHEVLSRRLNETPTDIVPGQP